jgi:glycosyltransferase involved in cell wall biosynthesis
MGERWSALLDDKLGRRTPEAEGRRHIALFLQSYAAGGAQRALITLAGLLSERDLDVDLVVAMAKGPLADEVRSGVNVVNLGARRTLFAAKSLSRYLRRTQPDVLLSTLDNANLTALIARAASRTRTRLVLRASNTTSLLAANAQGCSLRAVYALARRSYPRADALIAPSHGAAKDLARWLHLPEVSVRVVVNPVVTSAVRAGALAPLAHQWFADGAPPVVLAVGRFEPHKGFTTLLAAFAAARGDSGARLLILGEGTQRAALEELSLRLGLRIGIDGEVLLPGFDPNPFRYMARCHTFVLSSELEGLPGVLIQALACGAPVIATDCPSGPREILDGGKWGKLVPVRDVAAMAAALRDALQRPRSSQSDGKAAWAPYTAERSVAEYERLFEDLVP